MTAKLFNLDGVPSELSSRSGALLTQAFKLLENPRVVSVGCVHSLCQHLLHLLQFFVYYKLKIACFDCLVLKLLVELVNPLAQAIHR